MHKDYTSFIEANARMAFDAHSDKWSKLFDTYGEKWRRIFDSAADRLAQFLVRQLDRYSQVSVAKSLQQMSDQITIPLNPSQALQDKMQDAISANVALIKSIPQEYHKRIETAVMNAVSTGGKDAKTVIDEVNDIGESTNDRAKLIADDQTRKVTSLLNSERMKDAGIEKFQWLHSSGSAQPRPLHVEYDGQIFDLNDPPVIDERTGERGMPGYLINCHTGESVVDLADYCIRLYRRWYSGKLLSIVTDDDVVLRSTPNHPVFTVNRGWLPADGISVGDYLVNAEVKRENICKDDIRDMKTTFANAFDSAVCFLGLRRAFVPASGFDFHGDIVENDVDIVDVNGFLPANLCIRESDFKEIIDFILSKTVFASVPVHLTADGSMAFFVGRVLGAPNAFVSGLSSFLSFLKSEISSADDVCLRLAQDLDAILHKCSLDKVSANTCFFGDLKDAGSVSVRPYQVFCRKLFSIVRWLSSDSETDIIKPEMFREIVGVDVENIRNFFEGSLSVKKFSRVNKIVVSEDFSGHVYNLESANNWYICNNIITHNCRCKAIPVLTS